MEWFEMWFELIGQQVYGEWEVEYFGEECDDESGEGVE